jgi:hypothetical protein
MLNLNKNMTISKITSVAFLFAAFALGSCSKDDEKEDNKKNVDDVEVNIIDGHEYVDLDLPSGTLWATCNVGAEKPEEYGDYFAWGETKTKENYDWSTYKWCNGSEYELTKYCVSGRYGTVDNKTELLPEDDAATANWGSNWCMPTVEQIEELYRYAKLENTTQNGVSGLKITGRTYGKSIFLPDCGWRDGTTISSAGSEGGYWSRSINADPADHYAHDVAYAHYSSSATIWAEDDRYRGFAIRPVCSKINRNNRK